MKKVENGTPTYYLRSSLLGGQVVAEFNASGTRTRGYVYLGGEILAVQQNNQVSWMHQDPVAKSKRVTDGSGNIVSTLELDPWGGETTRSSNSAFQRRHFTTYERDGNASDEAMHRRYNRCIRGLINLTLTAAATTSPTRSRSIVLPMCRTTR